MYNTEETSMGARLPHTKLSDSQMGVQAHAGIRFELPEPPRISPVKLERLKTESVNNPNVLIDLLKESEAEKNQYYKDIKYLMEKQVNTISEQAESAKRQADAAIAIAEKKDLPGCISAGVAVISVIINLIVCRAEVWDLIQQILR